MPPDGAWLIFLSSFAGRSGRHLIPLPYLSASIFEVPIIYINIGIKAHMKIIIKKIEKILEKVCRYKNNDYLCIRK